MAQRGGFQQIPDAQRSGGSVHIPLSQVQSKSSKVADNGPINEKAGLLGRQRRGPGVGPRKKKQERQLTAMGKFYDRVLNFSIVTRYLLFSFPLGAVIAVPIVLGATVFGHQPRLETASGIPIIWVFTWVEVVWIALWGSKIFAKLLPHIFEFLAGAVSPGVRKYSLAIRRLEIPLSLVGWALTALATFIPIMQHPHVPPFNQCPVSATNTTTVDCAPGQSLDTFAPWTSTMQSILTALLVCSLLLLIEKSFVQFVSINYHAMQYDSRIKASKHQVYLLGLLYDASRALFEPFCPEFAEEDYIINDSLKIPFHHGTGSQGGSRNISGTATPVRLLQNVGRFGDQLTAAVGRVAHEVTGKDVFNPTSSHSVIVEALESKVSCEALARRIWISLVVEGKDALYQEDVTEVLADRPVEEAIEAFQTVDRDGNGDVSLDEMILTVCEIGRERKAVANSLHNIGSAINVLDNLLLLITAVGCIFVIIAFLNTSFNTVLVSAGTALLSLSFVFSGTAAEILNSCIFLFVKHPYDVDDRVDINKDQLVVDRISLLYTVFRNVQTHKTTQAPNSVLNSLWIDNVTRSKAMREQLITYISFDTTLEDVELLRREMEGFVHDKDNCRDFEPEVHVEVTGIASMDKMELTVEIKHKSNWANETVRASRRSKFMCALVLALRRVPIYAPGGGSATLGSADAPSYSVSVSDDQAKAARQAYASAKAAAHLKTQMEEDASSTGIDRTVSNSSGSVRNRDVPIAPATEMSALAALNSRSPAYDPLSPITNRTAISPIAESPEENILRRRSTGGKRRQSPQYGEQEPLPDYGGYLAAPPPANHAGLGPPPRAAQPPLNYGQPPSPPQHQQLPQQLPQQQHQPPLRPGVSVPAPGTIPHPAYSGRSQSPATGPRYEYPPAAALGAKPPSRGGAYEPAPGPSTQGRTSPPRPPPPPASAGLMAGNNYMEGSYELQ